LNKKFSFPRIYTLTISCLIALSMQLGTISAEGSWQAHPSTGCKVWNADPGADMAFTWTGDCKNGYIDGVGTLQWYEKGVPGDKYVDQYLRGKAHGRGVFTWTFPSARYEGDFLDGQRSGKGVQFFANGDRYEGDWRNDFPNGKGLYIWINEDRYQGDFVDGKPQGKGIEIWTEGTRYEGDFSNGLPNGKGIKTWVKGARYEGDIINGKMHGYGVITLRNGREFRGRWENDNYLGP